jgi:hypothetical protein
MDDFEWLSVFMVFNRLNDVWLRRALPIFSSRCYATGLSAAMG